ncbi:MAG: nitroreductase family protein [Gemmatimonadales bacterium]|nr:nitroreductase family protein [Gemmatimonadales bacterium]
MDTLTAIRSRRAVKHFDPNHRMTDEEIQTLMDAAVQSPTAFNMQNWRFVLVTDTVLRQNIRAAASDQAQVTEASLLLVITADLKAWEKSPERYWRNAPEEVASRLVNWMGPFYDGKELLQRDEAMRSCGLAGQTIMLAAKAMGYDTCPMIGFDSERVADLVHLPDDHVIGFLLAVGKGVRPVWDKPGQLGMEEVVIRNQFAPSAG